MLPIAILASLFYGCSNNSLDNQAHAESAQELESLAYTLYTDKSELFVEFKPLVVGVESRFAAHFTKLGEVFKALDEGLITLTLTVNGKTTSIQADQPDIPGIFRLRMRPELAGTGQLTFDIKTKDYTDQIIIENVAVYADEKAALEANPTGAGGSNDITYLKEQAWKVEFANAPAQKQTFHDVIKTSGQILPAPGDEIVITAKAGGLVLFSGNNSFVGSQVNAGAALFTITGGGLAQENLDATYTQAKATYEKSRADYDRANELINDKIISQREYLNAKLAYENAQTIFNTVAKNYSSGGQTISASIDGFIKNILVTEGQFVEAGTPLATISRNKNLVLQANVSQRYFEKLPTITSATFRTTDSNRFYDTDSLSGKVMSYGRSAAAQSPFVPVTFQINNTGTIIPGSVVEVYLKSSSIPDALVIPISSLVEEQGNFYVYVQMEGESFQKREVKLGANDGINVQVLSGVTEGERVVTKGAYQIKLSTASGTLPAHGHEH